MKKLFVISYLILLMGCTMHQKAIKSTDNVASNTNIPYQKKNNHLGFIYYDSEFDKAKRMYDTQPDSIKKYLLYTKNGYEAYFSPSDDTNEMIKRSGGLKMIMKKLLSADNYSRIEGFTQIRYDFIMKSKGAVLAVGVEIFRRGDNDAFSLNNQELNGLFEFGRQLKFDYKGYFDDEHILNMSYVFPLR
jgi:hypothetical protein